MKIYPNIIVARHKFFDNFLRTYFLFIIQGKLIALKYEGEQLNIKYVENTTL